MSTARKVIDWHGQGSADLARELGDLPAGRYVLVPEGEAGAMDDDLTAEETAAINDSIDEADRGELHDWQDVRSEIDGILKSPAASRTR